MERLCLLLLLLSSVAGLAAPPSNGGSSWPTLHGDPQCSGFYPQFPTGKLKLAWRKELRRLSQRGSWAEFSFKIICAISLLFAIDSGESQNIVGLTTSRFTANPVRLTDTDVSELFVKAPALPTQFTPAKARRIAAKREARVAEQL